MKQYLPQNSSCCEIHYFDSNLRVKEAREGEKLTNEGMVACVFREVLKIHRRGLSFAAIVIFFFCTPSVSAITQRAKTRQPNFWSLDGIKVVPCKASTSKTRYLQFTSPLQSFTVWPFSTPLVFARWPLLAGQVTLRWFAGLHETWTSPFLSPSSNILHFMRFYSIWIECQNLRLHLLNIHRSLLSLHTSPFACLTDSTSVRSAEDFQHRLV